jgi:hypothetical protein
MASPFVTVATFDLAVEAHVAKSRLESEGLEAFIADENIVNLNVFYSHAVGGVKLQVREEDFERARAALEISPAAFLVKELEPVPKEGNWCPRCHSSEFYDEKRPHWVTIAFFFLFSLPLPFFRKRLRCHRCGHRWKEKKRGAK